MDLKQFEFYRNDMGVLYCGDALQILPHLDPVDLVLTDPPYGIGETNEKNLSRWKLAKPTDFGSYEWDKEKRPDSEMVLIKQKSKNQIIFGGNYYASVLGDSSCWIVWDKDNSGDFADCELAWTSFYSAVRKIKWRWNGMLKESPEKRYHPTQKPVGLFRLILEKYSNNNDLICDCYLGSGTTAVACERLKRRWIGIEISPDYCEIAKRRIELERKQLKLF